ncbi:DUF262 domain-containing protein [Pseudodesulfovibrio sp.]|uniref:DUF262 domain-containing protein n=1 Tax=unclassified Pseudodesulfovibrio TaxID=2661612 RepID=UPI003B0008FB
MATILEQYRISDFVEWEKEKKLKLSPDFQRGSVWTPAAKTYLIDTILRGLPIPKIYLRTKIDIETKKSLREVVDGQQRLRAILDFANDKFSLSTRADEFQGLRYSTLTEEQKGYFLSYPLSVDQLLNASDDEVLEVFARLNSYSVSLNAAEKRHARYTGGFKWSVRAISRQWAALWEEYDIFTVRQRLRMQDDSFIAELLGIVLEGVHDGRQTRIDKLYKQYDDSFDSSDESVGKVSDVLRFFKEHFAEPLNGSPVCKPTHLLMLLTAIAHSLFGLPQGLLDAHSFLESKPIADIEKATDNLLELASAIASDEPRETYRQFWNASKSTTQGIASRRVRFEFYYRALTE